MLPVVLSVLAVLVSGITLYYVIRQLRVMNKQLRLTDQQVQFLVSRDRDDVARGEEFEKAVNYLLNIGIKAVPGSSSHDPAFNRLFPDKDLRQRIETHIVERNPSNGRLTPRPFDPAQMRIPAVRQTVLEVLKRIEKFKAEQPEAAKVLGLS